MEDLPQVIKEADKRIQKLYSQGDKYYKRILVRSLLRKKAHELVRSGKTKRLDEAMAMLEFQQEHPEVKVISAKRVRNQIKITYEKEPSIHEVISKFQQEHPEALIKEIKKTDKGYSIRYETPIELKPPKINIQIPKQQIPIFFTPTRSTIPVEVKPEDVEREQKIQQFIKTTREEALKGNPPAWILSNLGVHFTPADPYGVPTVYKAIEGKLKGKSDEEIAEDIQKIQEKGLRYMAEISLGERGKPNPPYKTIRTFVYESPVSQFGFSIIAGELTGGAVRSVAPALSGIGEKIPPLGRIGSWVLKHPTAVKTISYGITGVFEGAKIYSMYEEGYKPEEIIGEATSDITQIVGFSEGFSHGIQHGLPIKYEVVKAGDKTLWKGITLEFKRKAYPLFGETEKGYVFGTPKVDIPEEALKEGITPRSPTETKIFTRNVVERYPITEVERLESGLKLMEITEKQKSKFIGKFDFSQVKYIPKEVAKDFERWVRSQKDIVVYGSVSQYAQMQGETLTTRIPKDVDIMIPDAEKKAKELYNIFAKKLGKENVRLTNTLIEVKTKTGWHHAVDIHEKAISSYLKEANLKWYEANYIGFGFKTQPTIKIEGIETMRLSEQGIRKGVSSLTLREYGVNPEMHRVKDIYDFMNVQDALIKSMEKDIVKRVFQRGKIAEAKKLLNVFKSTRNLADITKPIKTNVILYSKGYSYSLPSVSLPSFGISYPHSYISYSATSSVSLSLPSKSGYYYSTSIPISLSIPVSKSKPSSSYRSEYYRSKSVILSVSLPSPSRSLPTPSRSILYTPSKYTTYKPPIKPPTPPTQLFKLPKLKTSFSRKPFKIKEPLKYLPDIGSILKERKLKLKIPKFKLHKKVLSGFEIRGIKL